MRSLLAIATRLISIGAATVQSLRMATWQVPRPIASSKGRNFAAWWFYGFLLLPIAVIHAIGVASDQKLIDQRKLARGAAKACPWCAEAIPLEAVVCGHCRRDLPVQAAPRMRAKVVWFIGYVLGVAAFASVVVVVFHL